MSKPRAQSAPAFWDGACTQMLPFTEFGLEGIAGTTQLQSIPCS